jgi:sulfite reductase (ferredoxin)
LRSVVSCLSPGLRLTGQQNILITDIDADQRAAVDSMFAWHGVTVNPKALGVRRDAMACPALPTCGLALADAERALPDVVAEIEEDLSTLGLGGERISIRMTGCPNGCARPFMGDIGFVGRSKDLYNIYVGGDRENTRMNLLYAETVPTRRLRHVIRPLLELWRIERRGGEAFGDFCTRIGVEALRVRSEAAHV